MTGTAIWPSWCFRMKWRCVQSVWCCNSVPFQWTREIALPRFWNHSENVFVLFLSSLLSVCWKRLSLVSVGCSLPIYDESLISLAGYVHCVSLSLHKLLLVWKMSRYITVIHYTEAPSAKIKLFQFIKRKLLCSYKITKNIWSLATWKGFGDLNFKFCLKKGNITI